MCQVVLSDRMDSGVPDEKIGFAETQIRLDFQGEQMRDRESEGTRAGLER